MTSNLRLITYLEARSRLDARRYPRTGKTSNIQCVPPNKKCGDRCIPPNWNCRITGGGLDSHSRAVEFDPIKGTSSIIRGVKNVAEGYQKADPEKIARGVRGVERGIVKLTPGDSIEEKQRFRKRLRVIANVAFIGTVTTVAGIQGHRLMKRGFPNYRNGLGAEIDQAARRATDRVMDTWDRGVDRVGLGGIFNTGRARIEGAGLAAAGRLSYQGVVAQAAENRLARPARFSSYLGTRARLRSPAPGIQAVHDVDTLARTEGWSRQRWEATKLSTLFSMTDGNNRSVYAPPAAHELLARQWGFDLGPREMRRLGGGDTVGTLSNEISRVRNRLLPEAISAMHNDLRADLQRRRFPLTTRGIRDYTDQLLSENSNLITGSTQEQRRRAERAFRTNINEVLSAANSQQQRSLANKTYNQVTDFYDNYFKDMAQRLRTTNGVPEMSEMNTDSPYQDAILGLARLHGVERVRYRTSGGVRTGGQRYPMPIRTKDAAVFINGYHYHTRVLRDTTPFAIKKPETLRRYAQDLSGQSFSTTQEAVDWFANHGFNIAIGRQRRSRRDAADSVKGKPCGASHIPKAHKCHINAAASSPERGNAPTVAANQHTKGYRIRQVASIVARVGAVGGGATFAVIAGRQAARSGDSDAIKASIAGATIAYLGVRSLQRERVTTHSSEELKTRYEKLKANDDVDPAVVDKLQKFIDDVDLDSQRVPTQHILAGVGGYFDTAKPDRVHISSEGMTIPEASRDRNDAQSYTKGVEKYMRYRASLTADRIIDAENASLSNMKRNFSASHWVGSKEGKQDYLLSHEIAHAIHYRGNFASPKAVVVNGKRFEGAALEAELRRSTSYYGQSDLVKKSDSSDNYYEQGNRLETFSENFALYVGNSRAMKEIFPVSYEWTRQTADYALAQPPKVNPRPFIDVVKELTAGTERFEPRRTRTRRDAPEDDRRILEMLKAIKTAAVNGDVPTTLEIFAEAQSLPEDIRFMFGAYLETVFMYSGLKQSA